MKRKALWLIVCALLIALMGWAGAEENGCDVHNFDYTKYVDNGNGQHGYCCSNCGEFKQLRDHYRNCTDPEGKCSACGADYDGEAEHNINWSNAIDTKDGYHGYACGDCGKIVAAEFDHFRRCIDPEGKCSECGADYDGETSHTDESIVWSNPVDNGEGQHGFMCHDCYTLVYLEEHCRWCTDPEGKCIACGAEYNGEELHENVDWDKCVDNGEGQHGYMCSDCNTLVDLNEHYRKCTDPEGKCSACGADYDGETSHGENGYKFVDNGDGTHSTQCMECHELFGTPEEHARACNLTERKCLECGADYDGTNVQHYILGDSYIDNGAGQHGRWCYACETLVWLSDHYHYCTDPEGKCHRCNAEMTYDTAGHNHYSNGWGVEHVDNGNGTHTFCCTRCEKNITEDHDCKETITLEPTDTTPGLKVIKCKYCDYTKEEEIPALKPAADPQYTLSGIAYDGSAITGSVAHVAGTAEVDRLYVRVAVFLSNGSYMITVTEVDDDMTFEIGASGDFVYMAIVATGTKKSVQPGNWKVLGAYEQEF